MGRGHRERISVREDEKAPSALLQPYGGRFRRVSVPGVRRGLQPAAEPISEACAVSRPPVRVRARDPPSPRGGSCGLAFWRWQLCCLMLFGQKTVFGGKSESCGSCCTPGSSPSHGTRGRALSQFRPLLSAKVSPSGARLQAPGEGRACSALRVQLSSLPARGGPARTSPRLRCGPVPWGYGGVAREVPARPEEAAATRGFPRGLCPLCLEARRLCSLQSAGPAPLLGRAGRGPAVLGLFLRRFRAARPPRLGRVAPGSCPATRHTPFVSRAAGLESTVGAAGANAHEAACPGPA